MLLHDDRGPFLMLSPAEAADACAALLAAGIPFEEESEGAAGCAGPETVILRFDTARSSVDLDRLVAAALRPIGPT